MIPVNVGMTGIKEHQSCTGCLEFPVFPFISRWWLTPRLGRLPAGKWSVKIVNLCWHARMRLAGGMSNATTLNSTQCVTFIEAVTLQFLLVLLSLVPNSWSVCIFYLWKQTSLGSSLLLLNWNGTSNKSLQQLWLLLLLFCLWNNCTRQVMTLFYV